MSEYPILVLYTELFFSSYWTLRIGDAPKWSEPWDWNSEIRNQSMKVVTHFLQEKRLYTWALESARVQKRIMELAWVIFFSKPKTLTKPPSLRSLVPKRSSSLQSVLTLNIFFLRLKTSIEKIK